MGMGKNDMIRKQNNNQKNTDPRISSMNKSLCVSLFYVFWKTLQNLQGEWKYTTYSIFNESKEANKTHRP